MVSLWYLNGFYMVFTYHQERTILGISGKLLFHPQKVKENKIKPYFAFFLKFILFSTLYLVILHGIGQTRIAKEG